MTRIERQTLQSIRNMPERNIELLGHLPLRRQPDLIYFVKCRDVEGNEPQGSTGETAHNVSGTKYA
jgi:hypothetical protein